MARVATCAGAPPAALLLHTPCLHCLCLEPGLSVCGILAAVLGPRAVRSLYRRRRGATTERRRGGGKAVDSSVRAAVQLRRCDCDRGLCVAWCDCDRRRGREVSTCPQRHAARHCASSSVCRGRGAFRLFLLRWRAEGAVAAWWLAETRHRGSAPRSFFKRGGFSD